MLLEFQSSAFDRSATSPLFKPFHGSCPSGLRRYARIPRTSMCSAQLFKFAPGEFVDRSATSRRLVRAGVSECRPLGTSPLFNSCAGSCSPRSGCVIHVRAGGTATQRARLHAGPPLRQTLAADLVSGGMFHPFHRPWRYKACASSARLGNARRFQTIEHLRVILPGERGQRQADAVGDESHAGQGPLGRDGVGFHEHRFMKWL